MSFAIESFGLTRRFGKRTAVDQVALQVPAATVYGFLGKNGAGKTTTIRMILSLIRPTDGWVRVFGQSVAEDRFGTASRIGAMVETPALYDRLTGRENLEIARRLRHAPRTEVDRVLELVDLASAADRLAGGYSQGMRQRLSIARALIGAPSLLILDEPANGLDPDGIRELRLFLKSLPERDGVTVFVSSHLLAEIEHMADHVGLMHDGRLLVQSALPELKASQVSEVEFGVLDPAAALAFFNARGVNARQDKCGGLQVALPASDQTPQALGQITRALMGEGVDVFRVAAHQPSLESIYLGLVGRSSAMSQTASSSGSADA